MISCRRFVTGSSVTCALLRGRTVIKRSARRQVAIIWPPAPAPVPFQQFGRLGKVAATGVAGGLRPQSTPGLADDPRTLYTIVRSFFGVAATHFRPEAELRIEIVALRHQLRILQRQAGPSRLRRRSPSPDGAGPNFAASLPPGHAGHDAPQASGVGPPEVGALLATATAGQATTERRAPGDSSCDLHARTQGGDTAYQGELPHTQDPQQTADPPPQDRVDPASGVN